MHRLHPLPILAIVAVIVVGLTFAASRDRPIALFNGSQTHPDQALAQMMQTQAEILRRLDRLESGRGGRREQLAGTSTAAGAGRVGNGQTEMSSAAIAARQADAIRDRENRFVNEPLAAAWAARSERAIGNALTAASLVKESATPPNSIESTCHSETCRVSMSFDDESQASFTKVVFLERIGEILPRAEIFQQTMADGTIRILVYARTASTSGRRG